MGEVVQPLVKVPKQNQNDLKVFIFCGSIKINIVFTNRQKIIPFETHTYYRLRLNLVIIVAFSLNEPETTIKK